MKKYKCFYKGKSIIVEGESTYKAQLLAKKELQKTSRAKVKSYDIHMILLDVTHIPDF